MSSFPERANVVIVGLGGIVGASVAHHLIERGWDDIVGIDKSGIPTDIGSTAHASDFCYCTSHDLLTTWTTMYSVDFYEKMGHYSRIGGLEVARVGDDERMQELKRKCDSARAFGTRAHMISASEAKEKFPLLEEDQIQGALWDPDAGLVVPRSQTVAGKLVDQAEKTGRLRAFANTPALELIHENGRVVGVKTHRGTIYANHVVVCAGLWGRLIAEMAGEDLPVMPVDHPLTFFGPYNEYEGTGLEIGRPLLRDQGNSAYLRDTGDPNTTEGGQIEWGYYYEKDVRMVHPSELLEKDQARLSPSQRDLELEDVIEPLERAMELTPILAELGFNESHSFNGLLQTTTDGGPSMGESRKLRGLWYAVAVWVKDGPGMGKLIADWMTDGRTEIDHNSVDYSRFNDYQLEKDFIAGRCEETAAKIYNPPVHPREPFANGRNIRRSPFYEREVELGGHFMELGGWERAHGYASNAHLLEKYADQVPVREAEWDNRHFWRVSNAEQLEMSSDCGIINLSHFHLTDITGPDHVALLEWLSAAKIGGDRNINRGIYTHFLDEEGMVRADFTILRFEDRCRLINGADAGPRDFQYMKRVAQDKGFDVEIKDVTTDFITIGIWGPNARENLSKLVENPEDLSVDAFPFATLKPLKIAGKDVTAFRISYVGEQGWELHMDYEDGLAVWDELRSLGITPVGVETYANTRRMEKSLRLQNADLLTQYNLFEADLARPKVKEADFVGKAKHLEYHARDKQPAMLCTLVMNDNTDSNGVARYPVGTLPIMDKDTGEVPVDELGRRSYVTSMAFGPTVGKNIGLAYLPQSYCEVGKVVHTTYMDEVYELEVAGVGYAPLYDPENLKPRS
ncbi:GcvT family protein [Cognatishimia maritima]|uniref:Glycine cleavage system T protein (Aminomethyltransferase) n=1 Tax=Cognatishimia maritima TaxID=870908 RepID=A0A1M5L9Z2_9RHOB|nr:FAD-dependent oxidoreductase [Cognatishimia maritima]SHG61828.1 Glycine cleavage system T protein (aminomethyltransferase) [Cognatishimia maritima]